ncbi:MAG: hypothetical protein LBM18_05070 [Oscillospiraceae bacterium]|jgi:hypothetical protein|nr:hypothetical protein [Oscillospiraceae bacterium]
MFLLTIAAFAMVLFSGVFPAKKKYGNKVFIIGLSLSVLAFAVIALDDFGVNIPSPFGLLNQAVQSTFYR